MLALILSHGAPPLTHQFWSQTAATESQCCHSGELLNPSEPHSFIQKIFTETYYVTCTVLDAGTTAVNKTDKKIPALMGLIF